MPGFQYAGVSGGAQGPPSIQPFIVAKSLNGAGTPPAAGIRAGDLLALTTIAALTDNSVPVVRMLLAADKTAHYKQGTPVAGILGVAGYSLQSDSSALALSDAVFNAASIPYPYSVAGSYGPDLATGKERMGVIIARPGYFFRARLDTAAAGITLTHQYDDTLAGLILSTTSGVTTYTVDTGAAAADQCLIIRKPDVTDPLYNTAVAQNSPGPFVFVEFLGAFAQVLTGVQYTAQ